MGKRTVTRHLLLIGAAVALAACQDGGTSPFGFLKRAPEGEAVATADAGAADAGDAAAEAPAAPDVKVVERDIEAPEVFSVDEPGLWDGRPSLGGVWVAHPSVKDPERVIVRNPANGKSVIGALFRRERENPGPKLQVSSDAAAALDILAGAPTKLSVVALRRKEVPVEPAQPLVTKPVVAAPEAIETKPIEPAKPGAKPAKTAPATAIATKQDAKPAADIATTAGAAIAAAEAKPTGAAPTKAPAGTMFVQIGIFSTEANAKRATEQMSKAGIVSAVRSEESQGKTFWRVVAGPASGAADRDALMNKIKGLGYTDAYAVSK